MAMMFRDASGWAISGIKCESYEEYLVFMDARNYCAVCVRACVYVCVCACVRACVRMHNVHKALSGSLASFSSSSSLSLSSSIFSCVLTVFRFICLAVDCSQGVSIPWERRID